MLLYSGMSRGRENSLVDNGKEHGNCRDCRVYIGFIRGYVAVIFGLYWSYIAVILHNGQENENYHRQASVSRGPLHSISFRRALYTLAKLSMSETLY